MDSGRAQVGKAVVPDPIRTKIRNQAGFLAELEFLELIDGGDVFSFEVLVKRKDGSMERFGLSRGNELGIETLRKNFFAPRLAKLLTEYRSNVEEKLADLAK